MKQTLCAALLALLPLAIEGSDERRRIGTGQKPKVWSDSTTAMIRGGGAKPKKPTTTLSPMSGSTSDEMTLEEELEGLPLKKRIELLCVLIKNPTERETAVATLLSHISDLPGHQIITHTLQQHEDRGAWIGSYSRVFKSEMESADFQAALSPFQENSSQSPQQQAAARAAHMKKKLQILEKATTALNESTQKAENVIIDFNTAMQQALKIATSELQKQQWYTHHNLSTFLELAGKGSLPEDYRTTLADRQKKLRESLGDTLRRCATFTTQQTANSFAISQTANPEQKIPKKTFHSFALTSLTASLKRKQDRKAVALKTAQEQAEREMVQAAASAAESSTSSTTEVPPADQNT